MANSTPISYLIYRTFLTICKGSSSVRLRLTPKASKEFLKNYEIFGNKKQKSRYAGFWISGPHAIFVNQSEARAWSLLSDGPLDYNPSIEPGVELRGGGDQGFGH